MEVTPQVGNSDNSAFYWTARGIWIKTAVAQTTGKMLSKANELGVRTPDINNFLLNQTNLRKARNCKGEKYSNEKQYVQHNLVGSSLMSLKVHDQRLVADQAVADREAARQLLRNEAQSSKQYRRIVRSLNLKAKHTVENCEYKNNRKINHLMEKQGIRVDENGVPIPPLLKLMVLNHIVNTTPCIQVLPYTKNQKKVTKKNSRK